MTEHPKIGVIIIGRNEGERLVKCLDSLPDMGFPIVYVDSGSTDDSVAAARERGAMVELLSMEQPFTAGRARNCGFHRLMKEHPETQFVQFIDGDCQLNKGWMDFAGEWLLQHPASAVVCGRRREIYPERSIYNQLCDYEWDTPVGQADSCGGDFMIVASAFADVGGFNESLIAGEEPELCFRLRRHGWTVYRADQPMTLHDADMSRFSQWWQRAKRAGYAYAARGALHRKVPGGLCRRENLRIMFWAALLPLAAVAGAIALSPVWLLILLAYPMQVLRLWLKMRRADEQLPAFQFAILLLLAKWPEFNGQLIFLTRWMSGAEQTLIEYK